MAKVLFRAIRTRSGYPAWPNMVKELEKTIDNTVKPELLTYFTRITDLWDHPVTRTVLEANLASYEWANSKEGEPVLTTHSPLIDEKIREFVGAHGFSGFHVFPASTLTAAERFSSVLATARSPAVIT